jgi:hypothetical protein
VIGHVRYGHSADIYAILAAEPRGPRYPAAGPRGSDSRHTGSLADHLPGPHPSPEGPVSAVAQAGTPVPTAPTTPARR